MWLVTALRVRFKFIAKRCVLSATWMSREGQPKAGAEPWMAEGRRCQMRKIERIYPQAETLEFVILC